MPTLKENLASKNKKLAPYYDATLCSCHHYVVMHRDDGSCMSHGCDCERPFVKEKS